MTMLVLAMLDPLTQLGWLAWSIHPSTVVGIAALAAIYLWRGRHAPAGENLSGARKLSFFAGLFVMFASLNGPIHDLSDDYLFSAHMVQHLLLTLAVPPLLLAGTPGWMLRPVLSRKGIAPLARFLTRALMAFVIFNVTFAVWHLQP